MTIKFKYDLFSKEPVKPFDDPDHTADQLPDQSISPEEEGGLILDPSGDVSPEDKPVRKVIRVVSVTCDKCTEKQYLNEILFWDTQAFGKRPESTQEQVLRLLKFCKPFVAKESWLKELGVIDIAASMIGGKEVFEFLDEEGKTTYIKMAKQVREMILNQLLEIESKFP